MKQLLSLSVRKFILYAGIVLACSVPVYYFAINRFWQYELDEHNILLTPEADREDRMLIIGAVMMLTFVFFLVLLIGIVLINRNISRSLWKPFYSSLEKIRQFDLHTHSTVQFDPTDVAEFNELNRSLDKLISGNRSAYNQQREFADHASHELQTPLAIIHSKLEILMQESTLRDSQYQLIVDALAAVSRVARINKNLLLLTRIENSQYMDRESIDLTALVRAAAGQCLPFAEEKGQAIDQDIAESVTLDSNRVLVEIVVNNLLTNAIRHSPAKRRLRVHLSARQLLVSNPGGSALPKEQLFRRFSGVSPDSPGTGLGLALIEQVCKRYGWSATYEFHDGLHTFGVTF